MRTPASNRAGGPLSLTVYDRIKQDIVWARLHPGEPLLEEDLAKRLRVSRTPVREALRRLNHEGLVRIVPNKGAFVRVLTPRDIREIYEVRQALEGFAAAQAAVRLSAKQIGSLVRLARHLEQRAPGLGYREVRDAWEALRRMAIAAADNERVEKILASVNDQVETARHYASAPPGRIRELVADFVSLVRALESRTPAKAQRLLQHHLAKSKKVLLEMFEEPVDSRVRRKGAS
ncbi:MAG TPA: GntR family transcriptional regulator [candidate division Zixibacteria bacterium]|nr:GntR family transcriptional regulator [candidate division Zixibacteria bacterium]